MKRESFINWRITTDHDPYYTFIYCWRCAGRVDCTEYEFKEPIQCRLFSKMLRTQDNDHYRVLVGDRKYALRVYQEGSHLLRQESDYEYELAWLDFLREQGLPVSYPIRRADGRFLNKVEAPEGTRYYALFSFAEGQPMNPRNENQLYALGAAMAKIHKVSNNFQTDYKRQEMNLEFLVDRPVARLQRIWGDRPERRRDLDLLVTSAAEAKEEILEIIRNPYYTGKIAGGQLAAISTATIRSSAMMIT
ncbi:MAG: phosphotransferase [Chloroflexota bacterium]